MEQRWIKKGIFILGLLFLGLNLQAQRIGSWKAYMAYQNATITAETPNSVFAVYDGSLLSYSPDDQEVVTYSVLDGLSDVGIKHMAYSPESKSLVLVYENSWNIDIFMGKDNVYNLPYIKDNIFIQDKTVNNLEIFGNYAYLSTTFGVVVIDLQRKEIKDTYKLGYNTQSVTQSEGYIYAATANGVLRAPLSSPNLADKNNWENYPLNYNGDSKKIAKILFFKGSFVFYQREFGVFFQDDQKNILPLRSGTYKQLALASDQLILVGDGSIAFFPSFYTSTNISIDAEYISAYNSKNNYWLAQGDNGLVGISKETTSGSYTTLVSGIEVNSPKRNLNYYMTFAQNKLLIVGGGWRENRLNIPGTLMVYEKGSWYNFDEVAISKQSGMACKDFTSVAVDPRDSNHYLVSSWGEGVYEFKNNEFIQLYSTGNSTLESSEPASPFKNNSVRVDGLAYDKTNNLYMVNSEVVDPLQILSANGEWSGTSYRDLAGTRVASQHILIHSRTNQKWINVARGNVGVFVLDDSNPASPGTAFSQKFVDQNGNDVGATGYFCFAEDQNGAVWVGTDNGPIFFSSGGQLEKGVCSRVILTGEFNGYYLLNGEKITAIAVDGGNRKWMGTAGSGVFLVDQSGKEIVVTNFNVDNSDLISNNINSIAINNLTGEVFIGTNKGLVSYMGDAIDGKPDYSNVYAFPNPVRPATSNQVVITGLMKDSNVKITDMAGNLIIQGTSSGGEFTWNCSGRDGSTVKSGIYLVFAATPSGGEGVVTKIMVIK